MANTAKPRDWYIPANPFEMDDEQQLAAGLHEIVTILTRIGGGLIMVANRQEIEPGMWVTVGFNCRWESYAPGKQFDVAEAAADEQPEEVAA